MDVFVKKFQPDRYKLWMAGKDNAPIDHSKPTPEAAEFLIAEKPEPVKEEVGEAVVDDTGSNNRNNEERSVIVHVHCVKVGVDSIQSIQKVFIFYFFKSNIKTCLT